MGYRLSPKTVNVLVFFVLLFTGMLLASTVVQRMEPDWSFNESFYFIVSTSTGLGLGDRVLADDDAHRTFVSLYTIAAMTWFFYGVAVVSSQSLIGPLYYA